jgi:N utilization substance protein B
MSGGVGPRRRGRELVFRLLYQADLTHDSIAALWQAARADERLPGEADEYVDALVTALEEGLPDLDQRIGLALERWNFERLAATDRSVLRLATAEFVHLPGTPARVTLDEAVAIARKYGREESGRFVNGVHDRLARDIRPGELEPSPGGEADPAVDGAGARPEDGA